MPNQVHDKYKEPTSNPHVPSVEVQVQRTDKVVTEPGGMGTPINPHGGDESPGPVSELSETNVRSQFIDLNAKP